MEKGFIYIKKKRVDVYGRSGYTYIGVNGNNCSQQFKRATFAAIDDQPSPEEMDAHMAKLDMFMLLSSDDMGIEEILPLYYTRQQVEQGFVIGKKQR